MVGEFRNQRSLASILKKYGEDVKEFFGIFLPEETHLYSYIFFKGLPRDPSIGEVQCVFIRVAVQKAQGPFVEAFERVRCSVLIRLIFEFVVTSNLGRMENTQQTSEVLKQDSSRSPNTKTCCLCCRVITVLRQT